MALFDNKQNLFLDSFLQGTTQDTAKLENDNVLIFNVATGFCEFPISIGKKKQMYVQSTPDVVSVRVFLPKLRLDVCLTI